jgi:transposase-like protein
VRGSAHSDYTRAAVLAALLTGQSISEVAAEYEIPEGTVKRWSAERNEVQLVDPEKKAQIGDLIAVLLERNLRTLTAQATLFADETWLRKQDASGVAVLYGVLMDKTVRILDAAERASQSHSDSLADAAQEAT